MCLVETQDQQNKLMYENETVLNSNCLYSTPSRFQNNYEFKLLLTILITLTIMGSDF